MLLGLVSLAALSACGIKPERPAPDAASSPFVAPSLAPTPLPTTTPTPPVTTKEAACTDVLQFVKDVTIPDGTVVPAGSVLDKRWEVTNSGTCNWNERYRIKFVGGSKLEVKTEAELPPARSQANTEIRIQITAPAEAGRYRAAWQAYSPANQPFGDPFYIDFIVQAPTP